MSSHISTVACLCLVSPFLHIASEWTLFYISFSIKYFFSVWLIFVFYTGYPHLISWFIRYRHLWLTIFSNMIFNKILILIKKIIIIDSVLFFFIIKDKWGWISNFISFIFIQFPSYHVLKSKFKSKLMNSN